MFAKLENGSALCLKAYGDIQQGAIVPPVNELWVQVVECDTWGDVPSDIDQRRERQRQLLKHERTERVSAPINNVQVATPEDRENVQWAASNLESTDWIMADNTVQTLTAADLQAVISQYPMRKMEMFAVYAGLLTQLAESDEPEMVVWPDDSQA